MIRQTFLHSRRRAAKTATASPASVSGSRNTAGTVVTSASTASGSGGTVSSYAWEYVSGDTGFTISTPSSASTTFSTNVSAVRQNVSAVFRCKVTFIDSTIAYTNNVDANGSYVI
ncbi:MAG: hypothetical protein HOQ02_10300 [Lysobacter sp.]|nr:hypothetical protein [Lysobacter sp.]